jgi:predicted TIM-barrel fold metal-dependent hydrolase
MIVDSHANIFPYLGDVPGFVNPREHLKYLQFGISGHPQPVRRARDNAIVPHRIWDADDPLISGYQEVNFRVGRYGRFEWTKDGVDYYKQYLPPSLRDTSFSADDLIAEMDNADVAWAILLNEGFNGKLNEMFAAAKRRYPHRLVVTAYIDDAHIDRPDQIDVLHVAANEWGMQGILFGSMGTWFEGYRNFVDEPRFDPFWAEVERLGLVVYWMPAARPGEGMASYLDQLRRMIRVKERHPALRTILSHGISWQSAEDWRETGPPDEYRTLLGFDTFWMELMFPFAVGTFEEYPYAPSLERVQRIYDWCGPAKLCWGSDMPNVMRHCTYRQSYEYIGKHADFLPKDDVDRILGGNLARIFGLDPRRSSGPQ